MNETNIKIIKKIQKRKQKTRDRGIRIKLELFILAHKLGNVSEACSRRGFSRTFYYKWWNRFKKRFELKSLEEKSRRPRKSPRKYTSKQELEIKEMQSKGYGARIIQGIFKRSNRKISTATINHIFNNRKKPKPTRQSKLKGHRKRYELPIPGQRVQLDVKYVPNLIRGKRAYNYVAVDECTRLRFSFAYMGIGEEYTFDFLDKMKDYFPFPIDCIQTDNGFEFTNRFNPFKESWDHAMEVWCKQNQIKHKMIPPGVKELNGKVERSHRIDEQYFYWRAPDKSIEGFNMALSEWQECYNLERPHGGLDYLTPIEKLRERMTALKTEIVDDRLKLVKRRFLLESPVMYLKKYSPTKYQKLKFAA